MRTLMTSPSFIRLTSPERQAEVAISSGPCTHAIGRLLFRTHCVRQVGLGGHPRVLISRPARRRHCRTGRRGGPRDDSWTRRSSSRPCPRPPAGPTRPALPSQATPGAVGSRPALRTQSLARTGRCRGCGGRPSRGATGTLSSPATGSATTARARPEGGSGETTTSTQSPPSTKFNQTGRRLDWFEGGREGGTRVGRVRDTMIRAGVGRAEVCSRAERVYMRTMCDGVRSVCVCLCVCSTAFPDPTPPESDEGVCERALRRGGGRMGWEGKRR